MTSRLPVKCDFNITGVILYISIGLYFLSLDLHCERVPALVIFSNKAVFFFLWRLTHDLFNSFLVGGCLGYYQFLNLILRGAINNLTNLSLSPWQFLEGWFLKLNYWILCHVLLFHTTAKMIFLMIFLSLSEPHISLPS